MQNWLQKLQSRKFLLAIGAIIGVWAGPEVGADIQTIATAIIAGLYAVGEGIADSSK